MLNLTHVETCLLCQKEKERERKPELLFSSCRLTFKNHFNLENGLCM